MLGRTKAEERTYMFGKFKRHRAASGVANSGATRRRRAAPSPWNKITDVALGATVGAVVALALAPVSQSFSFYLSQYLARPLLSIEYVEVVVAKPQSPTAAGKVQRLFQSSMTNRYLQQHPMVLQLLVGIGDGMAEDEANDAIKHLEELRTELTRKVGEIEAVGSAVNAESDVAKIKASAQNYLGPIFNSFPFPEEGIEATRAAITEQLQSDNVMFSGALSKVSEFSELVRDAMRAGPTLYFKLSILNRGDTDGLIRNVGTLMFSGQTASMPILRVAAPKLSASTEALMSVPVTVTNQPDSVRAGAVGKVEKHAMSEVWFVVDKAKLGSTDIAAIEKALQDASSNRFSITLLDQERMPIVYDSASR
jgi:hypothetical protein